MSELRLENNHWVDENGNRWSCFYWTHDLACKLSKTLVCCENCLNCIECFDCKHCTECQSCRGCTDCSFCYLCMSCEDCCRSDWSFYCTNCMYVSNCLKCTDCDNLVGLASRKSLSNYSYYLKGEEYVDIEIEYDYVESYFKGDFHKYDWLYLDVKGNCRIGEPKRKIVLTKEDGYYVDQFRNKWDVNKFSYEQVTRLALGLVGCHDCVNCIGGYLSSHCLNGVHVLFKEEG